MTAQTLPWFAASLPLRYRGLAAIVLAGLAAAAVAVVIGGKSPFVLLLAPVVFLVIATSIRYPLVALGLLVMVIVTNMSDNLIVHFGLPSIAKISAPALLMLILARWTIYRQPPYIGWLAIGCLLLILCMKLFSATYAQGWETSLKFSLDFVKDAIVALLALAFMTNRRGFETATTVTVLSVAFICAIGAYQLAFGRFSGGFYGFALVIENSGRFSGPLEDANFFATIIVFTIPLALFQVLNARGLVAGVFWAGIASLLVFGLLATQSRGGLIGLTLALMLLGAGLSLRQLMTFGLAFVIATAIAIISMSPESREHFGTIIGAVTSREAVDTSTEGRLASWRVALELFKDYPVLGVGVGNFKMHYQNLALELGLIFRGEGRSTHSLYLEYLAEVGLLGLGLLLAIIGGAATSIFRAVKTARSVGDERLARHVIAFGAGFAGYMASMTFLQDSFPRFLWFVMSLAVEMNMIVLLHHTRPQQKGESSRLILT